MLSAAKLEIRKKYAEANHIRDAAVVNKLCDDADDTAEFMRTTIVQAQLNDRGNYAMQPEERHLDKQGRINAQSPEDIIKPEDR